MSLCSFNIKDGNTSLYDEGQSWCMWVTHQPNAGGTTLLREIHRQGRR
jgi:hypothetical protein